MMNRIFSFLVGWRLWAAGGVAAILALSLYTGAVVHFARKGVADRVQTKIVTRYLKADAKETVRRETVIKKVQVRSAADVRKIDKQATKIAALMAESRRLSIAYDNAPCLAPDAVARLAAVGWGR